MAMFEMVPRRSRFFPVRDMFDRFFEELGRPYFYVSEEMGWMPPSDISENDKEYMVTMEIPGIDMKALDISFSNGMLSVRGDKGKESTEGESSYCTERYSGSFHRSLRIPGEVRNDAIDASYKDGILRVRLPKSAASEVKKIEIH